MAAYATLAEAYELYGEVYIRRVCDRDLDDNVDTASFERHLEIGAQEMDGYLLGRYPLPLAPTYVVPSIFKKMNVDIAVYNSAPDADVRTEEMAKRYDHAIKYMTEIAHNKIKIPLALAETPEEPTNVANASRESSTTRGRSIHTTYPARVFTPSNSRKIL